VVITPKGDAAMEVVRRRHAAWANELDETHNAEALGSVVTMPCNVGSPVEARTAAAAEATEPLAHVNR
jgi:hypothetical protein